MQLRLSKLLFLFTLILCQSACAIPSQDYLECNLPNGDQFILISKYNYSPLGAVLSHVGDVSVRENQGDYEAYFKPKNGKKTKEYIAKISPGFYGEASLDYDAGKKDLCNNFTLIGESYALGINTKMIIKDGTLEPMTIPEHDNFTMLGGYGWRLTEQEKAIHESLIPAFTEETQAKVAEFFDNIDKQRRKQYGLDEALKFSYRYFSGKFGNEFWEEYGLETVQGNCKHSAGDCPINAVWQTHSTDGGQTWSAPIITKDAKLFVIGKSILDQPAVAKPGKWKKGPG